MPPHLHRRPPLRQPMPASGRVLLLPPQHPQTRDSLARPPKPPLHLRNPAPRRPIRRPALHRPGPPAHRLQRHRPPPRRPPPLRPPDRQPQPPQTPTRHQVRLRTPTGIPNRRRDHHRPHPRHPRPPRRSRQGHRAQERRPRTHGKDLGRGVESQQRTQTRPTTPTNRTNPTKIHHRPHPPGLRRPFQTYQRSVIPTEAKRSGGPPAYRLCGCLFSFTHSTKMSFRPKAAHLPPQRRNPLLCLSPFPTTYRLCRCLFLCKSNHPHKPWYPDSACPNP